MKAIPETGAKPTFSTESGVSNLTVSLAADAEHTHVIDWVDFSYEDATNAAPTEISIIDDFDTVLWRWQILDNLVGLARFIPFPGGIYGTKGKRLRVTLSNTGPTASLNVRSR